MASAEDSTIAASRAISRCWRRSAVMSRATSAPPTTCAWLSRTGERRCRSIALREVFRIIYPAFHIRHRVFNLAQRFLRRQLIEILLNGHLDVGTQTVGVLPGFEQQLLRCTGYSFQMDVAAEPLLLAQRSCDKHELLHRIVRVLDYARAEKQALDVIPLVEIHRESNDLLGFEPRTTHVRRAAIDAVRAIPDADIRE